MIDKNQPHLKAMKGHPQTINFGRQIPTAQDRRQSGFTFVELLVVIGTLAVLAITLLPALAGDSKQSKNIQCANNLKQLGLCVAMYTDGYYDYYPPAADALSHDIIWPTLLRAYTKQGTNTSVDTCPEAAAQGIIWVVRFGGIHPAQNGYLANEIHLNFAAPTAPLSYGYNIFGSTDGSIHPYCGLSFVYPQIMTKKSQVINPADMIAMGDSNWNTNAGGTVANSGFIGGFTGGTSVWPLDVHGQRANLVFCDGHVQAMKRIQFVPDLAAAAGGNVAKSAAIRMWNYANSNVSPYYP
jgi:prepilin-type processing-associated H-X9-DG protein